MDFEHECDIISSITSRLLRAQTGAIASGYIFLMLSLYFPFFVVSKTCVYLSFLKTWQTIPPAETSAPKFDEVRSVLANQAHLLG